ncbi:MAG: DUF2281 domain-containing protein [Pyrinomonadaceae bacterium]|nr:DUF2281 domain-containing protein [Pyrinomonadaceae bacterium]
MTVEEVLMEKVRVLPPSRQQELLDFAEFLEQKETVSQPRRSLEGIWADLDVKITEEDIAEARKEMWGNFPREHFFENESK